MIKVYTLPTCQNCHFLLEWLDQQGIVYTEINAKQNPKIISTPTIEINDQLITGFNRRAIKKALQTYDH